MRPEFLTPLITGTPYLQAYYKTFSELFLEDSTNLITLYTTYSTSSTTTLLGISYAIPSEYVFLSECLEQFLTNFMDTHGIKNTYNTFAQNYYFPYLEKWLFIFLHDCIECQRNKQYKMKIQSAPTQSFSKHAASFNYKFPTKGSINPPSHNKSYIHVIIDAFSHFVVTVPIEANNAKTATKIPLHYWINKFGPPIYLVTDRGSEYSNKEMAHLCSPAGIRHSPKTASSPWTNGLVELQNRNLGTHLRMFLHDTP